MKWIYRIFFLCLGFSVILNNTMLIPNLPSKEAQFALALATMGIAIGIAWIQIEKAFGKDKKKKKEKKKE